MASHEHLPRFHEVEQKHDKKPTLSGVWNSTGNKTRTQLLHCSQTWCPSCPPTAFPSQRRINIGLAMWWSIAGKNPRPKHVSSCHIINQETNRLKRRAFRTILLYVLHIRNQSTSNRDTDSGKNDIRCCVAWPNAKTFDIRWVQ